MNIKNKFFAMALGVSTAFSIVGCGDEEHSRNDNDDNYSKVDEISSLCSSYKAFNILGYEYKFDETVSDACVGLYADRDSDNLKREKELLDYQKNLEIKFPYSTLTEEEFASMPVEEQQTIFDYHLGELNSLVGAQSPSAP